MLLGMNEEKAFAIRLCYDGNKNCGNFHSLDMLGDKLSKLR